MASAQAIVPGNRGYSLRLVEGAARVTCTVHVTHSTRTATWLLLTGRGRIAQGVSSARLQILV